MQRCRKLYLKLVSADKLPNVRQNGLMKVYGKVSVNGNPDTKKKTHVDREGETNPRWNFCVEYTLDEGAIRSEAAGLEVVVKLYCERMYGDRYIGEVRIAVKSLFDGRGSVMGSGIAVCYGVSVGGRLNIIYSFGEMFLVPVPMPSSSSTSWKKGIVKGVFVKALVSGAVLLLSGGTIMHH